MMIDVWQAAGLAGFGVRGESTVLACGKMILHVESDGVLVIGTII